MIKFSRAVLGAALLATAGIASAATASVTVKAYENSLNGPSFLVGADGADSGLSIYFGEQITVSVDPTLLWNGSDGTDYVSNANGHDGSWAADLHPGFYDGPFAFGALVGQIGTGSYFLVGTNYSGVAATSGELKFFYWDSDFSNNSGSIVADVTAVPEPMNIALMGLAFGAFALSRRRKA